MTAMGLFGRRIDPATGRPRSHTKAIRARAKIEDARADAAIRKTERLYQQRMSRRNAASN